ncbi:MAG: hypothetical protein ACLTH3_02200 [Lachnospira sp.]
MRRRRIANADSFIQQTAADGYDTMLYADGSNLIAGTAPSYSRLRERQLPNRRCLF